MPKSTNVTGNATGLIQGPSNTLSVDEHERRIMACHTETDALVMGEACALAVAELKDDDLAILRKKLTFGSGNFLKYASIGRAAWLYDEQIKASLPKSMSILYQFSLLRAGEIEKAIAESVVRPDVTRKELIEWKDDLRGVVKETDETAEKAKKEEKDLLAVYKKATPEERKSIMALASKKTAGTDPQPNAS
jgi:hypothetical protein